MQSLVVLGIHDEYGDHQVEDLVDDISYEVLHAATGYVGANHQNEASCEQVDVFLYIGILVLISHVYQSNAIGDV